MNNKGLDENNNNIELGVENTDVDSSKRVLFNNIDNYVMEEEQVEEQKPINKKFTPLKPGDVIVEEKKEEEINPFEMPKEEPVIRKSHKGLKVLLCIILIAIIGVCVFFAYTTIFAKPYVKAIDKVFSSIKDSYYLKDSYMITSSTSINSEVEELTILNGIRLDTTVSRDQKNNINSLDITYNEDNKKIIGIETLIKDSKIYLDLKELFDKTLFYDLGDILNQEKVDYNDINYLVGTYHKMLKASLKDEKNEKTKVNLNINNKNIDLYSNKYVISTSNLSRIINNSYDVVLKDKKAIEILAKYNNKSTSEMIEDIEESKDIYNDYSSSDEGLNNDVINNQDLYEIVIYTKGIFNDVVGFEFKESVDLDIIYYELDDYSKFDMNFMGIIFNMEGSKEKQFKVSSEDSELISGKIIEKSKNDYDISIKVNDYFTINSSYKIEELKTKSGVDTSNVIDINKLTEEDQQKIIENFQLALKDSKVYQYYIDANKEQVERSNYNRFVVTSKEILRYSTREYERNNKNNKYSSVNNKAIKNCGKQLDESYDSDYDYYIEFDKKGNVIKYYITDGTYYLAYDIVKGGEKGLELYNIGKEATSNEKDGDRVPHKIDDTSYTSFDISCGTYKLK